VSLHLDVFTSQYHVCFRGFGTVYLGFKTDGQEVAVKEILKKNHNDTQWKRRMEIEVANLATLGQHPNIVSYKVIS